MTLISEIAERVRALVFRRRDDREMEEELAFHLEMAERENLRQGMGAEAARRKALLRLGGVTQVREATRDARGLRLINDVFGDLRYGFRLIRRNPRFAALCVFTLALGIGLTATMFSIVYGALLRGLPFESAEQLVYLTRTSPTEGTTGMPVPRHDFEDWRSQQTVFSEMGAYYTGTVNVSGTERAERYNGAFATAGTLRLLRLQPMMGRIFGEEDELPGATPVVVLGHDIWRDRFGSDPDILGKTVRAGGEEMAVIGVMPDGFRYPQQESLWLPLRRSAAEEQRGEGLQLEVIARLRDGVTLDQANVQMTGIAERLSQDFPETNEGLGVTVQPAMHRFISDEPRMLLLTMLGAVFMVLLIACSNVANLLLSRAGVRMKEVGVRTALGASRTRVLVQFLTEPLLLAVGGALLGTGLAWAAVSLFSRAMAETNPPYWLKFSVDGPVLAFVLGLALFATIASGFLPAIRATGGKTSEILKDEARGTSSYRMSRLSRGLVVFQIALSCGLLVAAGLMIKSVTQLRNVDFGFPAAEVFTARVGLPEAEYTEAASLVAYFNELQSRLAALPQARASSLVDVLPGLEAPVARVALEGNSYADELDHPRVRQIVAAPRFFDVFDLQLRQGRDFGLEDRAGSLPVAIVNESFARRHFPDGVAVGERIMIIDPTPVADAASPEWRTVVGVAPDMHVSGVDNPEPEAVYLPMAQTETRFMSVVARSRIDPLALTAPVREAVASIDADIPIYFVETLAERISQQTWFYNMFGTIFMVMGGVALFLAAVGLYGVMSFSVTRRTREMGVRMALGAKRRDVLHLVLGQGLGQLATGIGIGLALAAVLSQLVASALFQVQPRDPIIFSSIMLLLIVVGVLASWIPARRATRADPMLALRHQ
jgi:putative ABC transport system permease protein